MKTFIPHSDGIVILPTDRIEETDSGLHVAEEKRRIVDRPSSGVIIACGPACEWVKVGMVVYFDKYKCIEVVNPQDNESYGALREADCFGELQ